MNSASPDHDAQVSGMFERIATGYDRANKILSCGIDILWRHRLLQAVEAALAGNKQPLLVDLAAGTLDVTMALTKHFPDAHVLALDFCLPMLLAGEKKIGKAPQGQQQRIMRVTANGMQLPLPDSSIDAMTVAFGLRNMIPRENALHEACRVLRPGGTLFVLEFGTARHSLWGGLYNWYLAHILPILGGLISGDKEAYVYLARTVAAFPTQEELAQEMKDAGFNHVTWEKYTGGIVFLHSAQK